jgi:hypothetical protein
MLNQMVLFFQSHPAQCMEAHLRMLYVPLIGYVVCEVKDLYHDLSSWVLVRIAGFSRRAEALAS